MILTRQLNIHETYYYSNLYHQKMLRYRSIWTKVGFCNGIHTVEFCVCNARHPQIDDDDDTKNAKLVCCFLNTIYTWGVCIFSVFFSLCICLLYVLSFWFSHSVNSQSLFTISSICLACNAKQFSQFHSLEFGVHHPPHSLLESTM